MHTHHFLIGALVAGLLSACDRPQAEAHQLASVPPEAVTLVTAPDQFYTANGVTIRYREIGDGEPVLLLHGYTDRVEMWAGPADSLATEYRVIVPDVRGFGLSSKFSDASRYGMNMVYDLEGLLTHLGVRQVHVMGYSMGGSLTAQLALRNPELVKSVTFVAGALWPDSATAARLLEPYAAALERGEGLVPFFRWILPTWQDSLVVEAAKQLYQTNDHAALIASIRAYGALMLGPKQLAQGRAPALAIAGLPDAVYSQTEWFAQHWPNAKLVTLETRDHADIFLAPELISEFRKLVASERVAVQ